jgi:hypothetical protein
MSGILALMAGFSVSITPGYLTKRLMMGKRPVNPS